jgi:hypothetical protein
MLPINLTPVELIAVTGRIKPSAQLRWLQQMGFVVLLRADGKPLVSRAHFEAKMGGAVTGSKPQASTPNFGAL